MEDFIGFTYNGKHCINDFGIYRTSDGSRYNDNLVPSMTDKTADVPGGDGQYFFQTTHKNRQFSVSIAFDHLTEQKYREMRTWLDGKEIHDLVFDEAPYKVYSAKVTGTPQLKTICFNEEGQRIYKGEGTIQFTCYYPYAHTPNFPDLNSQILNLNELKELEGEELKCGIVLLPDSISHSFLGMRLSGTTDASTGYGNITVTYNKEDENGRIEQTTSSNARYITATLDIKGNYLDNGEPYSNFIKNTYYSYYDSFNRPIIINSVTVRGILFSFPRNDAPTDLSKQETKTFLFDKFWTTGYSKFDDIIKITVDGTEYTTDDILPYMYRIITYQQGIQSNTHRYYYTKKGCFEHCENVDEGNVFKEGKNISKSSKNINHYLITNYRNKADWALASGLKEFYNNEDNYGDLPASFIVTGEITGSETTDMNMKVGDCEITIKAPFGDFDLYWNSKNGIVGKKEEDGKIIPIQYTGKSYGGIPVNKNASNTFSIPEGLTIEYNYWYY